MEGARRANETIYYAENWESSVTFYEKMLGFVLLKKMDWGFALFQTDEEGGRIGLMKADLARGEGESGPLMPRLSLNCADLEGELVILKSKGVRCGEIAGIKGETRSVNIYDQEGQAFFLWETGTGRLWEEEND